MDRFVSMDVEKNPDWDWADFSSFKSELTSVSSLKVQINYETCIFVLLQVSRHLSETTIYSA